MTKAFALCWIPDRPVKQQSRSLLIEVLSLDSNDKIIAAERLGRHALVISLSDGTNLLLTLDQLLAMGVPRFTMPQEEDSVWAGATIAKPPSGFSPFKFLRGRATSTP